MLCVVQDGVWLGIVPLCANFVETILLEVKQSNVQFSQQISETSGTLRCNTVKR